MRPGEQEPDHVGRIMAQWAVERPDLDVSPQGIIGRLHRLAIQLDEELRPVFAAAGLSDGDFDVLAAIRRSGTPYELSPGQISDSTMVTSGAVTKRLDRLEGAGLVQRRTSEDDARGRRVRLTERGRALVDETFEKHMANERRLVSLLGEADRRELARLLEAWGRALDA
ncbi:MAG: MarR family transcriptional regulator [Nocardioides sp.]|nr:MarR family transcriptional regulator [Nocardioides sp.]